MKNHVIHIFFILLSYPAIAQLSAQRSDSDCARLVLTNDTINYGRVANNANLYREVKYKNTGKCPLIIWSVNGLTLRQIKLSKNLVQPGDSGIISVYYPSEQNGPFFKTLLIYSNAPSAKVLYVIGTILPDEICAQMKFASDTINLGTVHYVYGKHFAIKVPSSGKCPLLFQVTPSDEYLNMINFSHEPIKPGDSGTIDIHLGGLVTGNYYGVLHIISPNASTSQRDIIIKAGFSPPDKGDSTDTEIFVEKDIVDEGMVTNKLCSARFIVKNTGKKPLLLQQPTLGNDMIKIPRRPIPPGKSDDVLVTYEIGSTEGLFIKHVTISGNFRGKNMPLYVRGYMKPN
jgi:hypothetical protein